MTHGHELRWGECWREWRYQAEGDKVEKKEWDNCNSIINKIYLKKRNHKENTFTIFIEKHSRKNEPMQFKPALFKVYCISVTSVV